MVLEVIGRRPIRGNSYACVSDTVHSPAFGNKPEVMAGPYAALYANFLHTTLLVVTI